MYLNLASLYSSMEEVEEKTFSFQMIVLKNIDKVVTSKALGQKEEYASRVESALKLCAVYYPDSIKLSIQADMQSLRNEIMRLKEVEKNEATRDKKILDLKVDFAETHEAYVYAPLSKIGIIKLEDEGTINYNRIDIKSIADAVRSSKGLHTATKDINIEQGEKI